MKFEVIDTVSVLYDHIAVHLNYYTIALLLLHVNVLFCMKFEVIDTVSVCLDCSTPKLLNNYIILITSKRIVPHKIWGNRYSVCSVWPDCSTP